MQEQQTCSEPAMQIRCSAADRAVDPLLTNESVSVTAREAKAHGACTAPRHFRRGR